MQALWDEANSRGSKSWLWLMLHRERMAQVDAADEYDGIVHAYVCRALDALNMKDYASVRRAIRKMADHLSVELKDMEGQ